MVLAEKTGKKNAETLHLTPTQYCHLPGFYLQIWFLNYYPSFLAFYLHPEPFTSLYFVKFYRPFTNIFGYASIPKIHTLLRDIIY